MKVPKVRKQGEESVVPCSSLVPPYVRKALRVEPAMPWLYSKGIAARQMQEALEVLVSPEAKGLSASVIGRLKRELGGGVRRVAPPGCEPRPLDLSVDGWDL